MNNHERMLAGQIYDPSDEGIMAEQAEALELMYDFNATRPSQQDERARLLHQMFGSLGEGCYFEPPLRANWGGRHVHIGDNTMFGPNVVIATAGHPILPELRARGLQFNLPVHIGSNVWIGGGSQIMPGVTIGDDTVIGAGSVVTRDIPSGVVAVGVPCRVVREISDHDREFYWRDRRIIL